MLTVTSYEFTETKEMKHLYARFPSQRKSSEQ